MTFPDILAIKNYTLNGFRNLLLLASLITAMYPCIVTIMDRDHCKNKRIFRYLSV